MAKIAPAFHSKVTRAPALFQTVVEPRPDRTRIISSNRWCCGSSLLARRDLADVAVVGGARGLVVDEHALAALARPRLQFDGAQVRHVLRADDVEPLAAHEAQIGRILLGLEFVRQFLRDDRVLGHGCPPGRSLLCSCVSAAGGMPQCAPLQCRAAASRQSACREPRRCPRWLARDTCAVMLAPTMDIDAAAHPRYACKRCLQQRNRGACAGRSSAWHGSSSLPFWSCCCCPICSCRSIASSIRSRP